VRARERYVTPGAENMTVPRRITEEAFYIYVCLSASVRRQTAATGE